MLSCARGFGAAFVRPRAGEHLSAGLAAQTGAEVEELWRNGDAGAQARLERRGFHEAAAPGQLTMVARAFDPEVDLKAMAAKIYITMGDSDLV